jgi:translation elongation factor EF-Tu-like GTPase
MPIASSIQITGRGTVVVGTIEQGILKKGDPVEIKGFDAEIKSVATDIQVFRKSVKEVNRFLNPITHLFSGHSWRALRNSVQRSQG